MVVGSNWPLVLHQLIISWYIRENVDSGLTALVSLSFPSAPYILPPSRIIAGIEASTITSLGEWKLVIPLAESTIASSGRCSCTS